MTVAVFGVPDIDGVWTTPALVDRIAREMPDHVALIGEGRSFTFAQLREEVRRTAAAMIALGVSAGDAVAIWSPNTWHWVVAALASQYTGGVLVPVNTGYTAGEVADILTRSGVRLLFCGISGADVMAGLDRTAMPALDHIVRIPTSSVGDAAAIGLAWTDFIAGPHAPMSKVDARAAAVSPDDVSDILFTSGTTGRSKGVVCTHRQSLSASRSWARTGGLNSADRYLCINPFFHAFGYKAGILACLQTGATLIPQKTFDPEQALRTVQDQRVTVLPGPPTLYEALLDEPARETFDISSWRFAITGAAMVPLVLIERMRRELDIDIVLTAYGLTEACGFGTMCRPGDDPVTVAATCGRPIAGFEVRIDAPDPSGAGEILLRGPNVMLGYLDDPAATAEAVDADGWLHTGDVGLIDAAGNLRITDRLRDMYVCGGLNVYPAEVEQVLTRLDGVAEVAVVGVPDERLGEIGRAFVVATPGARLDEQSVIAHAREHLANFKTPRSVAFVDALPRTVGGKVRKTVLREADYQPTVSWSGFGPRGSGGPPLGVMEEWIATAWQSLLNIDRPGRLDRFTDVGGDSLSAVELSRMLKDYYGITMSVDRFADRPTIADLAEDLQFNVRESRQPVIRLRSDGDGPVHLVIPGWAGNALTYSALAAALSGPCDVLTLSLSDLESDPDPRFSIRSLALAAVQHQSAAGRPIAVAGYSFGALVATDLACWLPEHGVPVAHLYLLDPTPLDSSDPPRRHDLRDRVLHGGLRKLSPRVYYALRRWRNPELAALGPRHFAVVRDLDREIETPYRRIDAAYRDGSIHLPPSPVSWVQSRALNLTYKSAPTIFGTPIEHVNRELIDVDLHSHLLQKSNAAWIADWIKRHPPADAQSSSGVADRSRALVHLRRNAFDPTPQLAEIRETAAVEIVPTPFGAKTYVLTRYDDVKAMLVDYKRFSTSPPWVAAGARPPADTHLDPRAGNLMVFDPPEHTRLRRMLATQFTTQRVARLEQLILDIVEDRLAAMESAPKPADLMETYALPISSLTICELLGVPFADRTEFQRRGAREFDMNVCIDERTALAGESRDYMATLVAAARLRPRKDILGILVREHGNELTDAELAGLGSLLLQAGHDTTANMIGLAALALLRHPDQLALVRDDPEAVVPAVEELLRWLSILQTGQPRFTTTDVEVAGVLIPARHPVFASLPAANRDPAYIDDPDTLDIRRATPGHLAFGHGIHRCLGAPLARAQLRIALPALFRRFPDLALAQPFEEVPFRSLHFIYGLNSLKVTW